MSRAKSTNANASSVNPELEKLYTKAEAAEILNVSPRFVERCVVERRISFVRVGRHIRIPASALTDFVVQQTVKPVP